MEEGEPMKEGGEESPDFWPNPWAVYWRIYQAMKKGKGVRLSFYECRAVVGDGIIDQSLSNHAEEEGLEY